ncbi:MAG: dTDP-4-dehydrorhamnose 3,5-epimerase [Oligoflexia bacterium]|nr:MAG: dTDP-4-dehydrorhamnose 3,5-epimerase [Oligoflexia bacterium]
MKIIEIKSLVIPEVKVIRYARFSDDRGYFTETFRKSDFAGQVPFFKALDFYQINESCSKKNVVRGLHFQWNPYMGKLVRTVVGQMVDIVLDIRLNSPTFGKAIAYDMPASRDQKFGDWIWVPPGFAHGNFYEQDTIIEYFCSGEWSPQCELGINPHSADIDWSLCDPNIKKRFDQISAHGALMADKDRQGLSLSDWKKDSRSQFFVYGAF